MAKIKLLLFPSWPSSSCMNSTSVSITSLCPVEQSHHFILDSSLPTFSPLLNLAASFFTTSIGDYPFSVTGVVWRSPHSWLVTGGCHSIMDGLFQSLPNQVAWSLKPAPIIVFHPLYIQNPASFQCEKKIFGKPSSFQMSPKPAGLSLSNVNSSVLIRTPEFVNGFCHCLLCLRTYVKGLCDHAFVN